MYSIVMFERLQKVDDSMEIKIFKLNAFTKAGKGGNPAGVVLESDSLKEEEMQYIANKVGASETAFIQKSIFADFKIRYFTPTDEVDICGHATIAAFKILVEKMGIFQGEYSIETRAGILEVRVEDDRIYLSQALPKFDQVIGKEEIIHSLNIKVNDLNEDLPIQIVSTGLRDILIPIRNREALNTINPNFDEIKTISQKYNVIGYHLFTLDSAPTLTAHCRNFAPLYDIPEESATGTSNGALTCYLHKYNVIANNSSRLVFEQGYAINASSEIISRFELDERGEIGKIEVGGTATSIETNESLQEE
jgi:PhzF family phenazine biosynthesis protein